VLITNRIAGQNYEKNYQKGTNDIHVSQTSFKIIHVLPPLFVATVNRADCFRSHASFRTDKR
jgi:hypothetical protein